MASMLNHRIPGFVDEKTKAFPNQVSSLTRFDRMLLNRCLCVIST
jgi:hypothetical protein